jgi:hypothetical protein
MGERSLPPPGPTPSQVNYRADHLPRDSNATREPARYFVYWLIRSRRLLTTLCASWPATLR